MTKEVYKDEIKSAGEGNEKKTTRKENKTLKQDAKEKKNKKRKKNTRK